MNSTIHIDKKTSVWDSRVISGPEYGLVINIGQWPISHSFQCKNQDFDGLFEILMGHLEKR